jgi:hypothetical protein
MDGFGHQEQVSYRQVGRRARGKLSKGPANRHQPEANGVSGRGGMIRGRSSASSFDGRGNTRGSSNSSITRSRNKASIPSRFETVLHHEATENDGFGSAATRFRHSTHDVPGPGKYGKNSTKSTFIWNSELKGSLSKKGYGGLVSKTNRFSDRAMLEAATMPGPGGSNKRPPKSLIFTRNDFSRGESSANFAIPKRYRDEPAVDLDKMPGPGHYKINPLQQMAVASCASGFRSKTRRFPRGDNLGVSGKIPGPGAHNVQEAMDYKAAQGEFKGAHSSFRSESQRGRQMILSKGIPGPGSYHVQPTDKQLKKRKAALENLLNKAPVGGLRVLGHDQRRLVSESKRDGLHFGSLGSDRFGQPYARKTTQDPVPGPGAYGNITEDTRPKGLASSSAFLSQTKRGIDAVMGTGGKPPGPAFYRPRQKMKKSFLLNASKRWV